MTTSRTDWPGSSEILAAVRNTGIYEEIAEDPDDQIDLTAVSEALSFAL